MPIHYVGTGWQAWHEMDEWREEEGQGDDKIEIRCLGQGKG